MNPRSCHLYLWLRDLIALPSGLAFLGGIRCRRYNCQRLLFSSPEARTP